MPAPVFIGDLEKAGGELERARSVHFCEAGLAPSQTKTLTGAGVVWGCSS